MDFSKDLGIGIARSSTLYLISFQYLDNVLRHMSTWSPLSLVEVDTHADAHPPVSVWQWQPEFAHLPLAAIHINTACELDMPLPAEEFCDILGETPAQWIATDAGACALVWHARHG